MLARRRRKGNDVSTRMNTLPLSARPGVASAGASPARRPRNRPTVRTEDARRLREPMPSPGIELIWERPSRNGIGAKDPSSGTGRTAERTTRPWCWTGADPWPRAMPCLTSQQCSPTERPRRRLRDRRATGRERSGAQWHRGREQGPAAGAREDLFPEDDPGYARPPHSAARRAGSTQAVGDKKESRMPEACLSVRNLSDCLCILSGTIKLRLRRLATARRWKLIRTARPASTD